MASVSRDGQAIMLCQQGQGQRGTWVWIGVEDIEPLHADFVAKGASFRLKPTAYSGPLEHPFRPDLSGDSGGLEHRRSAATSVWGSGGGSFL